MAKVYTTVSVPGLDNRLLRAMREGHEVLPADLGLLRGYLRLIDGLMAEKAAELEPSWTQACAIAAEIETLQSLETAVAERAIRLPAADLGAMRAKLEIWRALSSTSEDEDASSNGTSTSGRLMLSILEDVERLLATSD